MENWIPSDFTVNKYTEAKSFRRKISTAIQPIHCIFRILLAFAWHTEWSLLLHDVIGDCMLPFAETLQWPQQRLPMLLNVWKTPENCPFSLAELHPHVIHGSVHPPVFIQNGLSIVSAVFCTAHCTVSNYFTMFLPKIVPFPRESGPPSNTWYLGSTRVINPNSISIGSAVFVWVPNAML